MLRTKVYLLFISVLLSLSVSLNTHAGILIYEADGVIFVPQIKVKNTYYSAALKLSLPENASPTFTLVDAEIIDQADLIDDLFATYDIDTNTVSLFNVSFGEEFFNLNLQGQENGHFIIKNMQDVSLVSLLFMINSYSGDFLATGTYGEKTIEHHFAIDVNTPLIAFSDRPHRFSEKIEGGLQAFPELFVDSDFGIHPPNTTFSGTFVENNIAQSTIFEMEKPFIFEEKFIIPVKGIIGDQTLPPYGNYTDLTFVVDGFWGKVKKAASKTYSTVKNVAQKTVALTRSQIAAVVRETKRVAEEAARVAKEAAEKAKRTADGVKNRLEEEAIKALEEAQEQARIVQEKAEKLAKNAQTLAEQGADIANDGAKFVSDSAGTVIEAGVNLAKEVVKQLKQFLLKDLINFATSAA
jgi:hypothetical protein